MQTYNSQPIAQAERTAAVDVLRGFALGGVVLANLISIASFTMPVEVVEKLTSTRADKVIEFFFITLVDHKFITLFSLLFGYGFGVVMERVSGKGMHETTFFLRRMGILLAVGLLHIFFWWGEILHTYALCGVVLLAFRKASNKTLLYTAFFLLLVPTVAVRYLQMEMKAFAPPVSDQVFGEYLRLSQEEGLLAVMRANFITYRYVYVECLANITDMLEVLAKFLIGYFILRKGYLKNIEANAPQLQRFLYWCLPVAIVYVGWMAALVLLEVKFENIAIRLALGDFTRVGVLSLSLTYATSLVLLWRAWPRARLLNAMRYVGMMSLTNYLTHTLVYVAVLHGVGLGLMGRLHVYHMTLLALAVYMLQLLFSRWWLLRYHYGPAEWLWRQASYGRRFPLAKDTPL